MNPERWQQVDRVLQEALGLDEEDDRRAYLDATCAGDAALRAEVEALLGFEPEAGAFLAAPAVVEAGVDAGEPFAVGEIVGPYRIEALVGEGGMGAVFRARDERLGRAVAVKIVTNAADPGLVRRFTREARLASALNHPNILTVYDVGEADGVPYLVTEYVEGELLRAKLGSGMDLGEAIEVARQAASALGAAHAAGIVHRDVKPENVIVRGDGLVKVLDFGIAKLIQDARNEPTPEPVEPGAPLNTATGVIVGTSSYMSPEQARGEEVDGRTDVWSLGVMLYEMAAGRRPFRGATRWDVMLASMNADFEPLEGAPAELAAIVERALRKRADERYATAGEMAAALGALTGRFAGGGTAATGESERRTSERVAPATNLAAESEPLIGRARELRAIVDEMRRTRLLTVTGPGGTGKTRLAADAGRALLHEFEDGVFFVELAAVRDPGLVASAVAEALGVKEAAGVPLARTLASSLGERELLLVLDNFEQVVEAAPFVARLLAATPRVKALVTSRERLRVSAEREFALAPLELPPADGATSGEALERYGSVALFVERARAARPGFALEALGEANRRAVADVCRRLDGLPLAIELAAARLRVLTPEALLARLDEQLRLLTGGPRDVPERQQTMRAAIAWSYDLLDEDERRLFERLSIFSGGWTLEAAEWLDPDADVLDLLATLAEKSLVVAEDRGEEIRYRMLETIRQYAAERLAESGETARARTAHAAWFVRFVEAAVRDFDRARKDRRLDRELENVRAALEWSEGEGRAPEILLRLGAAMGLFWESRGLWSEGRSWLERALAGDRTPSAARAAALGRAGSLALFQSDLGRARELVTESLAMYRELGDRHGAGGALADLGSILRNLGDFDAADAVLREALAQYEDAGDARQRAQLLSRLGAAAYDRNDLDDYAAFMEEALAIHRELGDRHRVAVELFNLGLLAERRGDYGRATERLEESLALAREFGERPLAARAIHYLGTVARGRGDAARASELWAEASREYVAIGDRNMLALLFEDVVSEALGRGLADRAARLLGAMAALEEAGELPEPGPGETAEADALAAARDALGEAEADRAFVEGRRLTLARALELAFED